MSADESKRLIEEERAERAAWDLKSELKRAKALVDEARRRLTRSLREEGLAGPSRMDRSR